MDDDDQWIEEFVISASKNELIKLMDFLSEMFVDDIMKQHIHIKINEAP